MGNMDTISWRKVTAQTNISFSCTGKYRTRDDISLVSMSWRRMGESSFTSLFLSIRGSLRIHGLFRVSCVYLLEGMCLHLTLELPLS